MVRGRAAFAAICAASALVAHAATLIRLSDAELVTHGEQVVLGTVSRVSTSWEDPDGDGIAQIYTTVELKVEQSLAGNARPGETVTFRQLGGRIGNIEYKIPGLPRFTEGASTLVFLEGSLTNPNFSPVVGLAQGLWNVRRENDGTRYARRDFSDSSFVQTDKERPVEEARPSEAEEPLEDVIARFSKEIQRQASLKKHNGSRQGQEGK